MDGWSAAAQSEIIESAGIFPTRLPVALAGSTPTYTGKILAGPPGAQTPIPGSQLSALTLTILNKATGLIINGCDQVSILNTGRGTIDEAGNLSITLLPDDTSTVDTPTLTFVLRALEISWVYNAGLAAGRREVPFIVKMPVLAPAIPFVPPATVPSLVELGINTSYTLPDGLVYNQRVLIVDNLMLASPDNPIVITGNFNSGSTFTFNLPGQAIEPVWDGAVWVLA